MLSSNKEKNAMSNTFGKLFALTTFGESHGAAVGGVVDGCPARLPLSEADLQAQLDRRRPGQGGMTTPRAEKDVVRILSGVSNGATLGSPIAFMVENSDVRPADYGFLKETPRPSHADFTYMSKYGVLAQSGGGRAGARETLARVAGGAIAEKMLETLFGAEITAWVSAVGDVECPDLTGEAIGRARVDVSPVRCPDAKSSALMAGAIEKARADGDSLGAIVTCVCHGAPAGWGEPVFDKLHAVLAQAMLSIPAARGFEIGAGFAAVRMRGSEHNDPFVMKNGVLGTETNRSGGVQGGIGNGEPIVFRVAFKPTATIAREQRTANFAGEQTVLRVPGRHDPCVGPRAVPVVEAMAALVLADAALLNAAQALNKNPPGI